MPGNSIDKSKLLSLMESYRKNIEKELGSHVTRTTNRISSLEYMEFKQEYLPAHLGYYEKSCALSEKWFKIKPDKKKEAELLEAINIAHLGITPTGALSFSFVAPLFIFLFGTFLSYLAFQSFFFIAFFMILSASLIMPFGKIPFFLANRWRLKASNQMVLCIFYVVTYMRHSSNIEKAIEFAADHLATPLSLDLKKVLWDVETEKYSTVKESLDIYLNSWKKWNIEFIEAFHLAESSLYEAEESRRLGSLDKALDVILEETFEKMLHYAHNLTGPITMLHMLGVILPILGLVILPLVVSFMENVNPMHIAVLYNIALPIAVYFIGKNVLAKRPTGYGESDISEDNPELRKYRNYIVKIGGKEVQINPIHFSIFICVVLVFAGLIPLIMHVIGLSDFGFGDRDTLSPCGQKYCFMEYRKSTLGEKGPYGLGASIMSLFVVLGIGLSIGVYFKLRSRNVIKIRERAKKLELEFAGALYQLGNRLGDNLPVEIAVDKVAAVMEGTISGNFFRLVSMNIKRMGMSIEGAIFDPEHGALVAFPSNLIESSMKVLTQSVKKGPLIAAQALTNVSRYIKEIHRVDERLKDLMADIVSSMTSQVKFLTPAIAGVVIGITSMTTAILGKLTIQMQKATSGGEAGTGGALGSFGSFFKEGLPTYYFQIIVGIYVIQITYILTIMANGILNGEDKLRERYDLGRFMISSTALYCAIAGGVMILFNIIAASILDAAAF
ncbi:hypothetical protein HYT54_02015 [Candidatus Woesearchaeota archaeon]|nr:hypothetical protein [Candidatus Woesearchaeota archaeon]